MKSRLLYSLSTVCLALTACVSSTPAPTPGSKDAAVQAAWERFCNYGYCEGLPAKIVSKTDRVLEVSINGNTRYMTYTVQGSEGNYSAQVLPT
ncbi:MAG TPA: hypothetical protein PLH13_05575, partial [Burkholderiaceae bacterium]|nr:hypothetical protein [Burkholderiaceae bacterium]